MVRFRVRVFVQRETLTLDLAEIIRATRRYFDAVVDVESTTDDRRSATLRLESEKNHYSGVLKIETRKAEPADLAAARLAEERGHATGMASLAARCPTIWQVEPVSHDAELALLNLCGILASVALGPVLPDDGATLYGVRGSMERVEKMLKTRAGG